IPAIDTAPMLPHPTPPNNTRQNQNNYLGWAASNPQIIMQPMFYPVVKGDSWHLPGAAGQNLATNGQPGQPGAPLGPNDVRPGFDPNNAMNADPRTFNPPLTLKEKQMISHAKQMKAAEAAKSRAGQRAPSRPPTGRRGPVEGTDGGPGGYAPNDPGRPAGRPAPPPPHPVRPTYQPPPQESTD